MWTTDSHCLAEPGHCLDEPLGLQEHPANLWRPVGHKTNQIETVLANPSQVRPT